MGATYFLRKPNVMVGLRYGRSTADNLRVPAEQEVLPATDSAILSLRLVI